MYGWWTVLKEDHEAGRKLKLKLSVKKLINQVDQVVEGVLKILIPFKNWSTTIYSKLKWFLVFKLCIYDKSYRSIIIWEQNDKFGLFLESFELDSAFGTFEHEPLLLDGPVQIKLWKSSKLDFFENSFNKDKSVGL